MCNFAEILNFYYYVGTNYSLGYRLFSELISEWREIKMRAIHIAIALITLLLSTTSCFSLLLGTNGVKYKYNENAQTYRTYDDIVFRRVENNIDSCNFIFKDSLISFFAEPDNYIFTVKIENNSNSLISINWDKCFFIYDNTTSPIVFGNTSKLFLDKNNGKETIYPKTSILKEIAPRAVFANDYSLGMYYPKGMKKSGTKCDILLIITIDTNAGEKEYQLKYIGQYIDPQI